jgi:hypothetical protein
LQTLLVLLPLLLLLPCDWLLLLFLVSLQHAQTLLVALLAPVQIHWSALKVTFGVTVTLFWAFLPEQLRHLVVPLTTEQLEQVRLFLHTWGSGLLVLLWLFCSYWVQHEQLRYEVFVTLLVTLTHWQALSVRFMGAKLALLLTVIGLEQLQFNTEEFAYLVQLQVEFTKHLGD